MKFELDKSIEILKSTPSVLEKQLACLSKGWLSGREGGSSWSPVEIICHLIHCEEDDWISRMNIILAKDKNKKFKPFERASGFEISRQKTIRELLQRFKALRELNLKYLKSAGLKEKDFLKTGIHPAFGKVTLKQLISTWVVHDLSHIAQINRVMAKQYTAEIGPWIEYLPLLKK